MKKITIIALLLIASTLVSFAQKEKVVSGRLTYRGSLDIPPKMVMTEALEQLKLKLIADNFGTFVSETVVMSGDGISEEVKSFAQTEVKGEWIETIGEPSFSEVVTKEGFQVVTVSVKGRIRELTAAHTDLSCQLLGNGTDSRFETDSFRDGDELYLRFSSPIDGYLTVYLFDGDDEVQRLLPYRSSSAPSYPVKAGQEYVFFSDSHKAVGERVDQYSLFSSSEGMEINRLWVVFSPRAFSRAKDHQSEDSDLPRSLSNKDFNRWLSRCRSRDKAMCVIYKDITISK